MTAENICTERGKTVTKMKISVFCLLIISLAVQAQEMSMTLFATDNIFMSSDMESDAGLEWNISLSNINGIAELYVDGGIYLPFINYELVSLPYNAGVISRWYNSPDIILSSNMYIAGQWQTGYYYENTFEMPGLYNYIEYNPNYMVSISAYNDAYAEIFNSINTLNRITDIQHISLQFFFPRRIAVHINARGGWMYMYNEHISKDKYTINPLISAGLTDNIGLFFSIAVSHLSDGALPYYYDDSFINDFFYNEQSLSCGITIMNIIAERVRLKLLYSEMDYVELVSDSSSPDNTPVIDTFDNTDREDRLYRINASVTHIINTKPYTVSYEYEKRISTNDYYSYSTHYISLHFDF